MDSPMADEIVPDWTAIGIEPACPLCQYNLRGLAVPRCPECGHRFEWRELTDIDRRQHPYLFEHHPKHNIWSFFKTVSMTVLPGSFFRSLSPLQRTHSGRLFLYVILTTLPLLLVVLAEWIRATIAVWEDPNTLSPPWVYRPRLRGFWSFARYAWREDFRRVLEPLLVIIACFMIWPCLNFLALRFIFGQSMRRAKVDSSHVMRCIVYSHDATFWWGWWMVFFATISIWIRWEGVGAIETGDLIHLPQYLAAFCALVIVYRLWQAYRLYLRFDLAWATILASQVVVVLFVVTVLEVRKYWRYW